MGYQNAYAAYQKTNVNTASQGRLVVLLYEGAVKHLKAALNLFDANGKLKAGDIEQFGIHLQKTQAIITELQVSLDMEKGGDISRNLPVYNNGTEQTVLSVMFGYHPQPPIRRFFCIGVWHPARKKGPVCLIA